MLIRKRQAADCECDANRETSHGRGITDLGSTHAGKLGLDLGNSKTIRSAMTIDMFLMVACCGSRYRADGDSIGRCSG